MLKALERGVKGGKWFSLIDKVYRLENLHSAWKQVRRNQGAAGVDQIRIVDYERHLETNLKRLSRKLQEGSYQPGDIKRVWIPKPGSTEKRPLGIPTIEDRVVQAALRNVIEPIFEARFAQHSYGFRPRRGCKDALRRCDGLLKQGYKWVLDADLKGYFDTIDHALLMAEVERDISDGRILDLIKAFLHQGILDEGERWTPQMGTPQGGVISPLLANVFLDPLDHEMAEKGFEMVRYADDFIILCRSKEEAEEAMEHIRAFTDQAKLTLHPIKTKIVHEEGEGFDFLGYTLRSGLKLPSLKSKKKFRAMVKEKTRRNNGRSLWAIIIELNRSTRGWYEYFKHCHRNVFRDVDKFIRRRLRAILRKRQKMTGHVNGLDNRRWPNAYFTAHGFFSLSKAHEADLQSLRRVNY
ncbi:MAG: group II intron reverse transcriptase/maturase [Bradymonadaceae bacterium]|nr:group II intron reverse transcriptase/maturase [Lujinxingiaceae bacterium]